MSYAQVMAICSFFQTDKKMMTIQSVQCHVAADCTCYGTYDVVGTVSDDVATSGGDTWQGD
jgi:hypothetical protein